MAVKFYVGADHWGRKEWIGSLYPIKTQEKRFLEYYSTVFNFIELRSTFYQQDGEQIKKWINVVENKSFKFCPWVPQKIVLNLANPDHSLGEIKKFLSLWNINKEKLGPFTISILKDYNRYTRDSIYKLLEILPSSYSYVLNINNKSWQEQSSIDELLTQANKHSIGVKYNSYDDFSQTNNSFLYLKIDISESIDFDKLFTKIPKCIDEVFICLTGTDKIQLLEHLKDLVTFTRL